MEITLNRPMVDYWTITSYCSEWFSRVTAWVRKLQEKWARRHRAQYDGTLHELSKGNVYIGEGLQEGKRHYMMQIDGEIAHDMRYEILSWYPSYDVRCTRVDFQITVPMPSEWSQWELLVRLKNRYGENMVSYPRPSTSKGILLQTVYLGRREGSDRFLRVYMKLDENSRKLLRLETEIKRRRSRAIYRELCQNQWDEDVKAIIHSELKVQSQKDVQLDRLFYPYIEGHHKPVRVQSESSKTADWIVNTCIPSIDRHIHSHGADRIVEIENAILKMSEYIVWRKHE